MNRALLTSASQLWGTEDAYFDMLHALFGFTIDACASPGANKLPLFIPPNADGLNYSWAPRWNPKTRRFELQKVFNNPEYAHCDQWMPKARDEAIAARGFSVNLVPYRPDPEWWAIGALSEDGKAGKLLRSRYDGANRTLWLRFQRVVTGIHSVPDRIAFKDPRKAPTDVKKKKGGKAPFPSAVVMHFHPGVRPPRLEGIASGWML